jgi:hypothetical protein
MDTKTIIALVALAVLIAIAAYAFLRRGRLKSTVAREWSSSIAQYSIKPVFPPRDDVAVGDLFLLAPKVQSERAPRWKRLTVRKAGLSRGGALLPEFSLHTRSEGDVAALAPFKEIVGKIGAEGSTFKSAKVLLENVTTEAVDGVDILNALRDWDQVRNRSVIKPEHLQELMTLGLENAEGRVRFTAMTEVYKTDCLQIEVELSGKASGNIGVETSIGDGNNKTKARVSEKSSGSLKVRIEKKLPAPIVIGAIGYTYDVDTRDGTFNVDPIVTSGAGSGGFKD